MNAQQMTPGRSANRSLAYIGGGVVALMIITIVIVLLAGGREAEGFTADSPQGILQSYLAASEEGDLAAAHAYFSADVHDEMDLDAFVRATDSYGAYGEGTSHSVFFDSASGDGDRIVLHLTVEEFYGDGMNRSSYRSEREIRMVREADGWRIDEPLVLLNPAPIEPHL